MKKIALLCMAVWLVLPVFSQQKHEEKVWLYAKSIINQKAPELVVEEWITDKPDMEGKFVLIDFWATTCGPCKKAIPHLNEFSKQFKDKLVVIGVSYENAEKVKAMKEPVIDYYSAVDTKKRMSKELEINGIPHVILIDPQGIVRWEGYPLGGVKLTSEVIGEIIRKYENGDKTVEKKMWAKSFLNQKAPEFVVEKWLTEEPNMKGKFLLIDFWGPACAPCRKGIPDLNEFSKKFKDDLVVIGVSSQKEEQVRAMKEPVIEYYSAIDSKKVMHKVLGITGVPHAILVDPYGIVRWEGFPLLEGHELTENVIGELIEKYKGGAELIRKYGKGGIRREFAKSFVGKKAPELIVEEWYPKKPDTKGKFVLLDYFGFYCNPCRKAIPELNKWKKEFRKDLVVIGYAKDGIKVLQKMEPKMDYCYGSDRKARTWSDTELHVMPYLHLIDPDGIVRWEGNSYNLTSEIIKEVIREYKK